VRWTLDGEDFVPDMEASLGDQGIGHKSLLRFWTPGLDGLGESGA
jgi:phenol/toluene 2-monooxygenase (NADH) P4/A4